MTDKNPDIAEEIETSESANVSQEPAALPLKNERKAERKAVAEKAAKHDKSEFCVYLGPSIYGVIQTGTVYKGNRKNAEATLASAIVKYPLIARLIVTNETVAEDRIKVKTAGNLLYTLYKKLASGKTV